MKALSKAVIDAKIIPESSKLSGKTNDQIYVESPLAYESGSFPINDEFVESANRTSSKGIEIFIGLLKSPFS